MKMAAARGRPGALLPLRQPLLPPLLLLLLLLLLATAGPAAAVSNPPVATGSSAATTCTFSGTTYTTGTTCKASGDTSLTGAANGVTRSLTYSTSTGKFTGTLATNNCPDFAYTDPAAVNCVTQTFPDPGIGSSPAGFPLYSGVGFSLGGVNIYSAMQDGFTLAQAKGTSPGLTGTSGCSAGITASTGLVTSTNTASDVCSAAGDIASCLKEMSYACNWTTSTIATVSSSFFDSCNGHAGNYHVHGDLPCEYSSVTTGHSPLVAIALDGGGIYGLYESTSTAPTDLDMCNGHTGTVPATMGVKGSAVTTLAGVTGYASGSVYHYHLSASYPYVPMCAGPITSLSTCKALYSTCGSYSPIFLANGSAIWYDEDCPCGYPGIAYGYYPTGSPSAVTCSLADWGYVKANGHQGTAGTCTGIPVAGTTPTQATGTSVVTCYKGSSTSSCVGGSDTYTQWSTLQGTTTMSSPPPPPPPSPPTNSTAAASNSTTAMSPPPPPPPSPPPTTQLVSVVKLTYATTPVTAWNATALASVSSQLATKMTTSAGAPTVVSTAASVRRRRGLLAGSTVSSLATFPTGTTSTQVNSANSAATSAASSISVAGVTEVPSITLASTTAAAPTPSTTPSIAGASALRASPLLAAVAALVAALLLA